MTSTTSLRRRRRVAAISAGILAAGVSLSMVASPAFAAVDDYFELDGNVLDAANATNADPDWGAPETNSIFVLPQNYNTATASPKPVARNPLPTNFFDAGFADPDFIVGKTSDTSSFAGSSKDQNDIDTWKCKTESNMTDKGDIQNAYAAVATEPGTGHLILYFGMEKNAPNGNNNMGVWFLQDGTVGCDGTGVAGSGLTFTGLHQDGDIFLVAAFTNGGSTPQISAYQWSNGALIAKGSGGGCGTTGSADLCAITNDTASVTTPWQTTNKNSSNPQNKTGQGTTLDADQFYEGAVDMTANHLDTDSEGNAVCVNRFLFNTRSSQETSATLYDYAAGDVQTCASPSISTLLYQEAGVTDTALPANGDHTVTLPASVYDTATITGGFPVTNGTVEYSLWTDNACSVASDDPEFTNGTNKSTVNIGSDGTIPPSETLSFTTATSYWWQAHYEPGDGSRNDAATSDCTSEPLVIEKRSPTIATDASDGIVIGGSPATFNDVATISGGYFPASGTPAPGTVTFKLYGPFGASDTLTSTSCTDAKLISSATEDKNAIRVDNTSATATSSSFTPTSVGKYQWTAKYNGNAQNDATATFGCGDTTEQVVVSPATPTIATTMLLSDKAKVTGVTGAGTISGSVDFTLYKSLDCTGTVAYGPATVTLNSSGEATTAAATAVAAGNYSWKVQFTPSAGSNYTGVTTTCSPASEEQATFTYTGDSPIAP